MATTTGGSRTGLYAGLVAVILIVAVVAGLYLTGTIGGGGSSTTSNNTNSGSSTGPNTVINVVAAENFWGSLISQIGGVHVSVTSVVSDPNTDPHQYSASPAVAAAIANAKLVIENGMHYDDWEGSLVNASNTPGQTVVNLQKSFGIPDDLLETMNPHLWYSPYYVNDSNHVFYNALVKIDPTDQAYFKSNYATLNSSLYHAYMAREAAIKSKWGGAPNLNDPSKHGDGTSVGKTSVVATESIFIFMANATGLNILTPQTFMKAVAEGNDPTPADVATLQNILNKGNQTVACMIYNVQTVTPVTQQLKTLASQNQIPVTQVSETIQPPDVPFQNWMQSEVANLQNCLNAAALGA